MSEFVQQLKQEGVFAKEVRTGGIAFHSYFMDSIAPALLQALKKVGCCPMGCLAGASRRTGGQAAPSSLTPTQPDRARR